MNEKSELELRLDFNGCKEHQTMSKRSLISNILN